MKTKKSIAVIAALMLALSPVSSLPLAVSAYDAGDITAAYTAAGDTAEVITAAEYKALTNEQKNEYTQVIFPQNPAIIVTYVKEGEFVGTLIYSGSYVKKGTRLNLCNPEEYFYGSRFLVQSNTSSQPEELYTSYNGGDAWAAVYDIKNDDSSLYISLSNGADYGVLAPDEYSQLPDEMKQYYTQVNVQSPAYVYVNNGYDDDGVVVYNDCYVLKNLFIYIAMFYDDYMDNDIVVNGNVVNAKSSGGTSNFGISYRIQPDEDVINVESQPTSTAKSIIRIEDGTGIYVSYYVDDWTIGKDVEDGESVRVGTQLLIGCYKNLIAGYDIVVNGEVLQLSLNGDGTYMLSGYIPDTAETVVTKVKRDELSEYETANYVPVYFGSEIGVCEFMRNGSTIYYDSGDIIEKGSTLRVYVKPSDYEGKVLKINGNIVEMFINSDSSAYLADYVIPEDAVSLNIELDTAPAEAIPDNGTVTVAPTVVGAGAPEVNIENTETVREAVRLTSEEKAAVEAGADVKITLSVERADTTVAPEEKAAIEEAAPENFEVGIFLDIRMDMQVGGLVKRAVSTLMKNIGITVAVPADLINTDNTVNREYVIIHYHNGLTEVIPGSFNPVTNEITFPTDKFSTYAIAYKDTPKSAEEEEPPVPVVPTYSVTVDGSATVTGDRTAGSKMTVTMPFGMTARVYSGNTLIATLWNNGTFTMPAGNVKIIVTDESGAAIIASTAPNSYIFSYDSNMNLIKTTRSKKGIRGTGEMTVKLGAEYAGKTVTLYSGRKSTSEKLEEAVLDSKGNATFTVKGAKNYTLVVED